MEENRRLQYLKAMGVQVWRSSADAMQTLVVSEVRLEPVLIPQDEMQPVSAVDQTQVWACLQSEVSGCTACSLYQSRIQTVFGVGDRQADWMVIGEAPGASEDQQGEPFVGRAGLLLNEMLRAIGLAREQVFIANILKCRPPNNRDPQAAEVKACESFLKRQIELLQPKLILAVGRVAAQNLLKVTTPVGKLRGQRHQYEGIPLIVIYHPAYLLRSPLEKRKTWDDLCFALDVYHSSVS